MARALRITLAIMAVALVIGAPLIFAQPSATNPTTSYLALIFHIVPTPTLIIWTPTPPIAATPTLIVFQTIPPTRTPRPPTNTPLPTATPTLPPPSLHR
jgi:hypothetical protein